MGFLDFLFPKPKILRDDYFGEMVYHEYKKTPESNYFECSRYFELINAKIIVDINADNLGPTNYQKEFYLKIETEYNKIKSSLVLFLKSKFEEWNEGFTINDFEKNGSLDTIWIHTFNEGPIEWELFYEAEWRNRSVTFVFGLTDLVVTDFYID